MQNKFFFLGLSCLISLGGCEVPYVAHPPTHYESTYYDPVTHATYHEQVYEPVVYDPIVYEPYTNHYPFYFREGYHHHHRR